MQQTGAAGEFLIMLQGIVLITAIRRYSTSTEGHHTRL